MCSIANLHEEALNNAENQKKIFSSGHISLLAWIITFTVLGSIGSLCGAALLPESLWLQSFRYREYSEAVPSCVHISHVLPVR